MPGREREPGPLGKQQQSAERHRQKGQRCDRRLCAPCREHKPGARPHAAARGWKGCGEKGKPGLGRGGAPGSDIAATVEQQRREWRGGDRSEDSEVKGGRAGVRGQASGARPAGPGAPGQGTDARSNGFRHVKLKVPVE